MIVRKSGTPDLPCGGVMNWKGSAPSVRGTAGACQPERLIAFRRPCCRIAAAPRAPLGCGRSPPPAAPAMSAATEPPAGSSRGRRRGQCESGYPGDTEDVGANAAQSVGQDDGHHGQAADQERPHPRDNGSCHGVSSSCCYCRKIIPYGSRGQQPL
jgi:hypothetical protein